MPTDFSNLVLKHCMNEFAKPVNYRPQDAPAFDCRGVFDEASEDVEVSEGTPIATLGPVLGIRAAEFLVYPKKNDRLAVDGREYIVRRAKPDSHGSIKLLLNFANQDL